MPPRRGVAESEGRGVRLPVEDGEWEGVDAGGVFEMGENREVGVPAPAKWGVSVGVDSEERVDWA